MTKVQLLILDDWGLNQLAKEEALDRLVHSAYRIEINGESMRKERGKVSSER